MLLYRREIIINIILLYAREININVILLSRGDNHKYCVAIIRG